jgi:2-oxo-4-hydroxy-4-carboxy--5-ureidoimidazoline (OHCU) decarboxylase
MASTQLPGIATVPSLGTEQRAHILDLLFEPSTQLHTLSVPLLHEKTFASYNDLISAVGVQLTDLSESASSSDTQWLESILGSHPRLGAKKVDSAQSQAEQAQLQGSGEEAEQLRRLNAEYEAKFPGLRYVVFVNGRSRQVIMEDMKQRIAGGDIKAERAAAIRVCLPLTIAVTRLILAQAMCEIAADRATKLT